MPHTKKMDPQLSVIESALTSALVPVLPPKEMLGRLQNRIKDLTPGLAVRKDQKARANLTFLGLAGAFAIVMTVAVGFRTVGSIVGGLALMNEFNRQVKSRKAVDLTPTV